jgi:hypothetical protein
MGLLEKYLQKEIERLKKDWNGLTTDAEKMENKNLRQEMIDTIAFYLMDKSDGIKADTGAEQCNLPDVIDTVCCENCINFYPDTKTCDKTCIEYNKFKQQTGL